MKTSTYGIPLIIGGAILTLVRTTEEALEIAGRPGYQLIAGLSGNPTEQSLAEDFNNCYEKMLDNQDGLVIESSAVIVVKPGDNFNNEQTADLQSGLQLFAHRRYKNQGCNTAAYRLTADGTPKTAFPASDNGVIGQTTGPIHDAITQLSWEIIEVQAPLQAVAE